MSVCTRTKTTACLRADWAAPYGILAQKNVSSTAMKMHAHKYSFSPKHDCETKLQYALTTKESLVLP